METTKIDTALLHKLLAMSESMLAGDYSKRVVTDFKDGIIDRIINNLNRHSDNLQLSLSEINEKDKITIDHFIDAISSFANHNFDHQLPISEDGTILDAIATGINILGEELEQTTVSKYELEIKSDRLNEAQAIAKLGSWEYNLVTGELIGSKELYHIYELEETNADQLTEVYKKKYHPEDHINLNELLRNAVKNEKDFSYEHRIVSNDGSLKHLQGIGGIVKNAEGKVIGLRGTVQDITERKNAEIELKNSLHVVTEQNKRLLNFSYIVSHNLASHAGNISSLLFLITQVNTKSEKEKIMQHLKTSSDLLNETIHNLSEVISIHNNVNLIMEQLNLHDYIDQACKVLSTQIVSKKAQIKNNIPKEITVNYNPAYLESIVLNFLSNGIKYAHPDRDPVISFDGFYENNYFVMRIADNGIGIDMKKHGEKLFGLFKTFHGNKDSRGIGLFITKNQIEAMGGKVEAESEVDVGTIFKIFMR